MRNGSLSYIDGNAGCRSNSRLDTTPGCITTLTPSQVAALDPKGIGVNSALLSFINSRYPQANDLSGGDGINTGLFRFNAPTAALGVMRNPHAGEIGNRNVLRGPSFWNVDLAVLKNFKMPWSETQRLQFRWVSFNAFNHNAFGLPNANIRSSSLGLITTTASAPREMQFALRYDF